MLKKIMMYAVVMGAHIPLCATPTKIVSHGDAYVIRTYAMYARLDQWGESMHKEDGTVIYESTDLADVELQPNMAINIRKDWQAWKTDITIKTQDGREVLSRRYLQDGRTIELQGTTCTIDGNPAE
jgi:hypothetical protein